VCGIDLPVGSRDTEILPAPAHFLNFSRILRYHIAARVARSCFSADVSPSTAAVVEYGNRFIYQQFRDAYGIGHEELFEEFLVIAGGAMDI
jgi:hypothetical protein